jgi:hypothetical protein
MPRKEPDAEPDNPKHRKANPRDKRNDLEVIREPALEVFPLGGHPGLFKGHIPVTHPRLHLSALRALQRVVGGRNRLLSVAVRGDALALSVTHPNVLDLGITRDTHLERSGT